jgi:hypothetical protein
VLKNKNREMTLHPLLEDSDGFKSPNDGNSPGIASAGSATPGVRVRDPRQSLGMFLIGLGVIVLMIAWWGVSGTADTVDQLSYIGTGVCAGACFLVVGTVLLVACEHTRDRDAIQELSTQLRRLEEGLAGEFDHMEETLRPEHLRRA